jgi:hypothetical protein
METQNRSSAAAAKPLVVLLAVLAGASAIATYAFFNRASVIDSFLRGDILGFAAEADRADSSVQVGLLLFGLAAIATTVLWIRWRIRYRRTVTARKQAGWVDRTGAAVSGLFIAWIAAFAGSIVLIVYGLTTEPSDDDVKRLVPDDSAIHDKASADRLLAYGFLAAAAAALLFLFLVRKRESILAEDAGAGAVDLAAPSSATPPGWHPDPYGQAQLRWWDGTQWTHEVNPPVASAPPPGDPVP